MAGIFIDDKILQRTDLDFTEKGIYSLIYLLTDKDRVCCATNEYIAAKLNVDIKKVVRTIKHLVELKLIIIQKKHNNNRTRGIIRYNQRIIYNYENGFFEGLNLTLTYNK